MIEDIRISWGGELEANRARIQQVEHLSCMQPTWNQSPATHVAPRAPSRDSPELRESEVNAKYSWVWLQNKIIKKEANRGDGPPLGPLSSMIMRAAFATFSL